MSIRILPQDKIKDIAKGVQQPSLLFPNIKNIHSRRSERLRKLAVDHPFAEYLLFIASLTDAQGKVLEKFNHKISLELKEEQLVNKPLNIENWQLDNVWIDILQELLTEIDCQTNDIIEATIDWLQKASNTELQQLAKDVLLQKENVAGDKALFIWAALSVYWLVLAARIPHTGVKESGDHLYDCPVCGSAPSASVIHMGDQEGLRYLHCSLCETEWNLVRAKCSQCDQSGQLEYWLLEEISSAIKAESCGDCNSYLKAFYKNQDANLDVFADDLATIFLDAEMEKKGFFRSGPNPFLAITP